MTPLPEISDQPAYQFPKQRTMKTGINRISKRLIYFFIAEIGIVMLLASGCKNDETLIMPQKKLL